MTPLVTLAADQRLKAEGSSLKAARRPEATGAGAGAGAGTSSGAGAPTAPTAPKAPSQIPISEFLSPHLVPPALVKRFNWDRARIEWPGTQGFVMVQDREVSLHGADPMLVPSGSMQLGRFWRSSWDRRMLGAVDLGRRLLEGHAFPGGSKKVQAFVLRCRKLLERWGTRWSIGMDERRQARIRDAAGPGLCFPWEEGWLFEDRRLCVCGTFENLALRVFRRNLSDVADHLVGERLVLEVEPDGELRVIHGEWVHLKGIVFSLL